MDKAELRGYRDMRFELSDLKRRIQKIEDAITSARSGCVSSLPRGGVKRDLADKICDLADLKALYELKWADLCKCTYDMEKAISSLPSKERLLMRYRYLDGLTWEQVAVKLGFRDVRQVYRLHGNILMKI